MLSCGFGPPVLTSGDVAHRRLTAQQVRLMARIAPPGIGAPSYLLADALTGEVLLARDEHDRRSPASMTKMVTALVALERARQDLELTVERQDVRGMYSVLYLKQGEELSLRQLLFMLLISSDNAAANTIARGVAGDVDTFVGWMNEYVQQLGLHDTHFANPHGYDDPENYSTAFDMAAIGRHAMNNPVIADIVRRPTAIAAWRNLESTNELLVTYPGAVGIKTGTTDEAGECLAALADRPTGRALAVVMGSEHRFHDSRLLLDYYYATYAELHLDLPPNAQNRFADLNYEWHTVGLESPVTILVRPWQLGAVSMYRRIDQVQPNPSPAEPIGSLLIHLDGRLLWQEPLYVRQSS